MTRRVDSDKIEGIVGVARHKVNHIARAVSSEQTVYILHSQLCLDTVPDLRDCPFSLALDRGIDVDRWPMDEAIRATMKRGRLVPHPRG